MSSYRRRLMLANQTEENLVLYGNSVQDGTPTPEAPIDIMSIENPTIKVTGENLIPFSYYNQSGTVSNGVTYTVNDDGSVTVNGASSSATSMFFLTVWSNEALLNDWFKDGETYVISGNSGNAQVILQAKSLSDNKDVYYYGNGKPFTIDKSTYKYCHLRIQVSANRTVDNVTIKPMLNKGTEALPYEPYEEQLITIDETTPFGENLFKTTNYTKGTLDYKTGNMSTNTAVRSYCLTTDYIYLKRGAYVVSNKTGANLRYICFYDIGKTFKNATWTARTKTFKFTVIEDCYVRIDVERDASVTIDNFDTFLTEYEFMINEGMNALVFEPYIPPITTMRGVGDYKDRIYTKDGRVWFEQRSAWYETDASDIVNLNNSTTVDGMPYLQLYITDDLEGLATLGVPEQTAANNPGLCSHFEYSYKAYAESKSNTAIMLGSTAVRRFWFSTDKFTDANEATLWLDENTITAIYPLKNPIITEITGSLAEKILAIDKSKNIIIYSDNGVYGNTEVVEE